MQALVHFYFADEVYKHHTDHSTNELIEFGPVLMAEAQKEIDKHRDGQDDQLVKKLRQQMTAAQSGIMELKA